MMMTSSRPYLLRAIYEWIVDNRLTPYLLVNAEQDGVEVPRQYVENGKIVLNMGPRAVQALELGNDEVSFSARFAGTPMSVHVPITAALAIYAKENGQGMIFTEEDGGGDGEGPSPSKAGRPQLKVVK